MKLVDGANTVADYQYDGVKRRVVVRSYLGGTLTETRHLYYTSPQQWQVVEERVGTSPDTAPADLQYVWGMRYVDDLILRDKSSERLYAMQDANWNTVALANSTSAIQERYAYSPYGAPVFLTPAFAARTSSSFTWQRLFTGQTFDTATGLHRFRNRMLHSQVGTFLTRDQIGYADGMNIYRYVGNQPTIKTGSSGQKPLILLEVCLCAYCLSYIKVLWLTCSFCNGVKNKRRCWANCADAWFNGLKTTEVAALASSCSLCPRVVLSTAQCLRDPLCRQQLFELAILAWM